MQQPLRRRFAARARHVAVSYNLAQRLPYPLEAVLPNPYDTEIFYADTSTQRRRDLIFVGRLIPEKAAHVLIEAVAILKQSQVAVTTTIVGDGPEGIRLRSLAKTCGLGDVVEFAGQVTGTPLARLLREHRVLAVPSVYEEPFGIVALEGIACGCVVIGSDVGGLPEAIGPCGLTFPATNAAALASNIADLLRLPDPLEKFRSHTARHLEGHHPKVVVRRYVDLFAGTKGKIGYEPVLERPRVQPARSASCVL